MMAQQDFDKIRDKLVKGLAPVIQEKRWEEGSYALSFRSNMASPNWVEMRLRSPAPENENKAIDDKARAILAEIDPKLILRSC